MKRRGSRDSDLIFLMWRKADMISFHQYQFIPLSLWRKEESGGERIP
jgi:hypothetical protein